MVASSQTALARLDEESSSSGIQLQSYDYLHLYVGNAYQFMHFLRSQFAFTPIAYAGLETGARDCASYVLAQGNIRLVLSGPLDHSHPIADEIRLHGDAVKEIAFAVEDAAETFHRSLLRGASPVVEPMVKEDDLGRVTVATIKGFGNLIHSFVQRSDYSGPFLPGYRAFTPRQPQSSHLLEVDHVALSLPRGGLDKATEFYGNTLDLEVSHEENIVTQYSAMNSKVVQNKTGTVRFPMMEPGPEQQKSQIEEYLKYNQGPGVQHLAFSSSDIVECVRRLQDAGAEFLTTPHAYYDLLAERVGAVRQDVNLLRDLNILVDCDEWGQLLQIFSKPVCGRPTLFFELIQREGARGFGSGNIRALFAAVEREQRLRGNL